MALKKRVIEKVQHYQRKINRHQNDEFRLLRCVLKLNKLPISADDIQKTDIYTTVNSIGKFGGDFDRTVNELIQKWNKMTSTELNIVEHSSSSSKLEHTSKMTSCSTHKSISHHKSSEERSEKISESGKETKSKSKSSDNHNKQEKKVDKRSHKEKHEISSEKKIKSTNDHSKDKVKAKEVYRKSSQRSNEQEKHKYREDKSNRRIENGKKARESSNTDSSLTKCKSEGSNKRKRDCSTDGEQKVTKDKSETNKRQRLDHIKNHEHLPRTTLATKINVTTNESKSTPILNVLDDFSKDNTNTWKPDLLPATLNQSILADLNAITLAIEKSKVDKQKAMGHRFSFDKLSSEESKAFFNGVTSKTTRPKMYSGVKSDKVIQPSSLLDNCIRVLQKDIHRLKYTGNVSFSILEPVLQRATPKQLLKLENYNPYLMEASDSLWKSHVERHYRTQHRQNMETWREMFERCQEEEQRRLSKITENIKQQKLNKIPVRKTQFGCDDSKLIPRGIRRRKLDAIPITHVAEVSKPVNARQRAIEAIKNTSTTKVHFVPNRSKPAPLMAKTLKFYRKLPK